MSDLPQFPISNPTHAMRDQVIGDLQARVAALEAEVAFLNPGSGVAATQRAATPEESAWFAQYVASTGQSALPTQEVIPPTEASDVRDSENQEG